MVLSIVPHALEALPRCHHSLIAKPRKVSCYDQ